MPDVSQQILALTGDWPIYPGHPIVVATAIMHVYETYAAASRPTGSSRAALCDARIPGASDHVNFALTILGKLAEGESIDSVIAQSNEYWIVGKAGGHVRHLEAGLQQAIAVEPLFKEKAISWVSRG